MRVLLVANFEPDAQKSMRLYADWVKDSGVPRARRDRYSASAAIR